MDHIILNRLEHSWHYCLGIAESSVLAIEPEISCYVIDHADSDNYQSYALNSSYLWVLGWIK